MNNIIKKVSAIAMAFTLLGTGTTIVKSVSPKSDNTLVADASLNLSYGDPENWYWADEPLATDNFYPGCGYSGRRVKWVQTAVNYLLNYGLAIDGSYGPATKNGVMAFQTKYNYKLGASRGYITVDGYFGPQTRSAMYFSLKYPHYFND